MYSSNGHAGCLIQLLLAQMHQLCLLSLLCLLCQMHREETNVQHMLLCVRCADETLILPPGSSRGAVQG